MNYLILILLTATAAFGQGFTINDPVWIGQGAAVSGGGGGGGGSVGIFSTNGVFNAHNTATNGKQTNTIASVPAGALLVLTTTCENDTSVSGAPMSATVSGGGLTWTKQSDGEAASSCHAEIWTAVFAAGGTIFVTNDWGASVTVGPARSSVLYAITNQEVTIGGAQNTGTAQAAPAVALTTTRANSLIICVTGDWNAVAGARTYRAPSSINAVKVFEDQSAAGTFACFYHYYYPVTTATSYTIGLTAPAAQSSGTCAYEVRGP